MALDRGLFCPYAMKQQCSPYHGPEETRQAVLSRFHATAVKLVFGEKFDDG
jgi:hypothetical protein